MKDDAQRRSRSLAVAKPGFRLPCQYGTVLVAAMILYGFSCAPGLLWQDSGLIQYRTINNDIQGFLGLALSHPLFYLLAICTKAIPWAEVVYKVNLLSALAGAIAVANLFLFIRLWTGRSLAAILGTGTLALSHTFWQHASMAETYTLWAALFTAELIVVLQYTKTRRTGYLYGLGLLNGLAAAVHMLAVIPLAVYVVYVGLLWKRRALAGKDVGMMVLFWMVGCLPYEYLIARNMIDSGNIIGALSSALFGNRWKGEVLNAAISGQLVKENLLLWVLNFPTPNAVLAFIGTIAVTKAARRDAFGWLVLAMVVLFLVFAFRYTVPDRYAFFIPFYCMVSILIGCGAHRVLSQARGGFLAVAMMACVLLPVGVYAAAPRATRQAGLDIRTRGDVPYRDDLRFFLTPWKTGYAGAGRFAVEALTAVGPGAVIYADLTTVGPLLVTQQAAAFRSDVAIVSPAIHSPGAPLFNAQSLPGLLQAGPVYVVSRNPGYCPAFVREGYDLVQAGLLWQVRIRGS